MARLREDAPDLRVIPVLSELRKDAGLPRKDLAQAFGTEIAHILPRDDKAILRAHRAGRPLAQHAPRSGYVRAVSGLWSALSSPATPAAAKQRRGLLRRARA